MYDMAIIPKMANLNLRDLPFLYIFILQIELLHSSNIVGHDQKQIEADNPNRPFMEKMHRYSQANSAHYETAYNNAIVQGLTTIFLNISFSSNDAIQSSQHFSVISRGHKNDIGMIFNQTTRKC